MIINTVETENLILGIPSDIVHNMNLRQRVAFLYAKNSKITGREAANILKLTGVERCKASKMVNALRLGMSIGSGSGRPKSKNIKPSIPDISEETLSDSKVRVGNEYWESQFKDLSKKYKNAIADAVLTDRLVSLAERVSPKSYETAPRKTSRKVGKSAPQSAVLLLSDTHVGQVIDPGQTMGFGEYNFKIFLARLKFLEERVISITQDHTNTDISELVVAMMGDMIHGALGHGSEADQHSTLFSQVYGCAHALALFLTNLAPYFPCIRVDTVVGNHSRFCHQHKMPTVNRYSNLDTFVYALVKGLVKSDNISINIHSEPFRVLEVQNHILHLSHGDHWRGGDKALGIPNHSIGRQLSTTSQLFAKDRRQAPNYYLTGHWHRSIEIPHSIGAIIINGGFPGLDNYALASNFNPVDPSQKMFMMHPKYGRTSSYDIQLKFADLENTYRMPGDLDQFGLV